MAAKIGLTVDQIKEIYKDISATENTRVLEERFGGIDGVLKGIGSDKKQGVSEGEIAERTEIFGVNRLPEAEQTTWLELFFQAFNDATVIILIVSALVSLAVGVYDDPKKGWIEGTAILAAVLIVAVVTATNDYGKETQFRALTLQASNLKVQVLRGGHERVVDSFDLVVGDVCTVALGDKVPADGLVLAGVDLHANESALTGEPEDVPKGAGGDPFLYAGTLVTGGTGRMVVCQVGPHTVQGRLQGLLAAEQSDTPLQEKLDVLAQQIGYIGMGFAVLTFAAMMLMWYHDKTEEDDVFAQLLDSFIMAVTIVVVAVPEGLPLAVTISLAYSTTKMLRDNNLIRVLSACETMGNATAICSDKTGTLTQNRMTVVGGQWAGRPVDEGFAAVAGALETELLAEGVAVNTTAALDVANGNGAAPTVIGNATEGALLLLLHRLGLDYRPLREAGVEAHPAGVRLFPFTSDRKLMSVLVARPGGGHRLYTKGAPERVLARCALVLGSRGRTEPLAGRQAAVERDMEEMMSRAMRVLALAHRDFAPGELPADLTDVEAAAVEGQLTLDGMLGIMDPLRPDVVESVAVCQASGIFVRMITGDHILTAQAIAEQCGIYTPGEGGGLALSGHEFRALTPAQLDAVLPRLQVVARATPEDKLLLVSRLNGNGLPKDQEEWEQRHPGRSWATERDLLLPGYRAEWSAAHRTAKGTGEVVGVTGDGTNDAPALKLADVGLSMGICGTEVARAASDIILLDDNFSSIVKAILWGRNVFDNIRKFLQFQLTVNTVALTLTLIGAVAGFNEPPLNAVMMLWVNLIMDTMGALALGTELPGKELLDRRPYKRNASLVNRIMWRNILCQSAYQLGMLYYVLMHGAGLFGVPFGSEKHFTLVFNAFVFCQVFNEFNARSIGNDVSAAFRGLARNGMFAGVIFFTCLTQWALVQYGGEFTRTAPLTAMEWAETVLLGSLSVPVGVLMRCLPPFEENPANFASTPLLAADDSRRARERGRKPEAVLPALFAAFVPTAAYILFRFYKLNPDIASEVIDNFKGSTGASEL
eukprot:CAMPEP_0194713082 /NCGR_PEP_ID=MMETSP0296-20130528/5031_1 /TAXON_ID=39354 /ORGANISM="Heterosigma akashiwo, Strain CCMP2393" /LENGTH=1047 /DNA_ID=CAMNT_0039611733 /DNA_START=74 /DNA_END=3217 /DNA_ORIENTATION=+